MPVCPDERFSEKGRTGIIQGERMGKLTETFFHHAERNPDKPAIWCEGSVISYGKLADLVKRWASGFLREGMKRGDAIGVILPNSIEFVALMLVAADLGVILAPLNSTLPVSAIHGAFRAAGVRHVVAKSECLQNLRSEKSCDFSAMDGIWLSLDEPVPGCRTLAALLSDVVPEERASFSQDEDPFIMTMTSGSTGEPKPIVLTQGTKVKRALAAVELYNLKNTDRILAATPLYHSLAERLVLVPLLLGGTSVLMSRYSPAEWIRCVSEQAVSFTIAVSSQLRQLAQQLADDTKVEKVGSLRCIVASSEQLEPHVKAALLSKLRCEFHECYGTSEVAVATNLNHGADLKKLSSVGKPAPGVEIRILREDHTMADPGEPGEIVCRTPLVFSGYFKLPELTKGAFWGEFFRTGDLGKLDEDGFLYFLGRKKDIIITGGINVYPRDIESVLVQHPSVLECAAFPLPDENLGEIVAVAVVPRSPTECDQRKLRNHCAEHLADFQQPRKFFFLAELPKSGVGKIAKRLLPGICQGK